MFLGRKEELSIMEDLYKSARFEFLVLYGRRRIGKTSLLQEFSRSHKTLMYSAQEKNDALNLLDFSKSVQNYFEGNQFFRMRSKLFSMRSARTVLQNGCRKMRTQTM